MSDRKVRIAVSRDGGHNYGKISTSTDGNTWTLRYTNPDGFAIGAIARTV